MKTKYVCSHCKNNINVGEDIVLVAKNDIGEKGLVFLHTELGNYTTKFSPSFTIIKGDIVKFSCPICHQNLTNHKNERLAHFIQIDENNNEYQIVFSQIYGENCTYKIEKQEIKEYYGDHWNLYQNPDWFMLF